MASPVIWTFWLQIVCTLTFWVPHATANPIATRTDGLPSVNDTSVIGKGIIRQYNTTNGESLDYRIPGTPLTLELVFDREERIDRALTGVVLLEMNQTLYEIIDQHAWFNHPLGSIDDPFTSENALTTGNIYISVQSWVPRNPHMTYGVVAQTLQGLWNVVYMGRRQIRTTFRVVDDEWAMVGFGSIRFYDPRGNAQASMVPTS